MMRDEGRKGAGQRDIRKRIGWGAEMGEWRKMERLRGGE